MRRSTGSEPARQGRLIGRVAVAVLTALLLTGLTALSAQARQSDNTADPAYTITAAVAGDVITVSLDEVRVPVGALELELRNVPALVSDECTLLSGMGACAQTDEGVRIVALNPTGWQEPAVLLELEFTSSPTDAELVIGRGTDVTGTDLAGSASTMVDLSSSGSSDSSIPGWAIAIVVAAVAGLVLGIVAKRRSERPTSHPE